MDAVAERELIAAVKAGDEASRNRLVLAFQVFAEREARRQAYRKGLDPDDAAAEMFYAIWEAADRFDSKAGARFATFLSQLRETGEPQGRVRYLRPQTGCQADLADPLGTPVHTHRTPDLAVLAGSCGGMGPPVAPAQRSPDREMALARPSAETPG